MTDAAETFGARLGRLMDERGLKPKDLEEPSGLDRETIRRLVAEERGTSFEAGLKIAKALGEDPWMLAGIPPPIGDFRVDLAGGSRLTLELRLDQRSDAISPAQIAEGLASALTVVFPGSSVTRSARAVKPAAAGVEGVSPLVLQLQAEVERAHARLDQLGAHLAPIVDLQADSIETPASEAKPPGKATPSGRGSRGRKAR